MIKVNAIQCPKCEVIIYSRARHDCRRCKCRAIFIDGGFDYIRIGGIPTKKIIKLSIKATKQELWEDWNTRTDKYGYIEEGKV